jgi:hypothetical protein
MDPVCSKHLWKVALTAKDNEIKFHLAMWKQFRQKYHILDLEWKRLKRAAANSYEFGGEKSIHWEYGMFCLESKVEYNLLEIFQSQGREFLIRHSKVNMSNLINS